MKKIGWILLILLIGVVIWARRGVAPAVGPAPTIIPQTKTAPQNTTGLPLTLPNGFSIATYAKNVPNARVLVLDPKGRVLVSSPASGKVFAVSATGQESVVVQGLRQPHGLAFKNGALYIAENNAVAVYDYDVSNAKASARRKIIDLPSGGNHFTRTIGFGPDGKLYIAIGSTCNVCVEDNAQRAKILVANADGSDLKQFATGLRNSVFFTWHPVTKQMWATDMGRDLLGDNTPPEEVNIILEEKNYGWPYCYSKRVHDKSFDAAGKFIDFCKTTEPPVIEYQAHSAPLGIAFIPAAWGKEYAGDLLVAYHGSWNRTEPTGYKIVRFKLDDKGNSLGAEDFISGWLSKGSALGRPVDLLFDDKGNLYISDDKAGVVYKIFKT